MLAAVLGLWTLVLAAPAPPLVPPGSPDGVTGAPPAASTSPAAGPTTDPQALLERADAALGRAGDGTFTIDVAVVHADGTRVERTIQVWQRGRDERMVKFLAPARLRGTGILLTDGGRVLVYLPAYGRVREVTGREGGDAFLGTGFSVDELALVRFAPTHVAAIAEETADAWVLRLTPRVPADHEHAALLLRMRRADDLVTRVTYLDAGGAAYRELEMGDYRTVDGHTVAHRISVTQAGEKRRTVAEVKDAALDRGIDASFFTERQLRRSP